MPRKRPLPATISASSTGLRAVAEQQIDVADDAGADRGLAVAAARGHRRHAIGELDLADGPERLRAVRAVHRAAIDIDGGDDVVAGGDVGRHLLDHVAQAAAVPEMVMRIDDRAGGIDDLLGVLRQPVFAWIGVEPALGGGCSADGHEFLSLVFLVFYCFVIASSSEAIHLSACGTMDCFAALAMTAVGSCALTSHPIQNDHRRRARQRVP